MKSMVATLSALALAGPAGAQTPIGIIPTPVQCYEMFQAKPADDQQAAAAWSLCQCMNASWAKHMTAEEHQKVTSSVHRIGGGSPEAMELINKHMPTVKQECPFPEGARSMAANPW